MIENQRVVGPISTESSPDTADNPFQTKDDQTPDACRQQDRSDQNLFMSSRKQQLDTTAATSVSKEFGDPTITDMISKLAPGSKSAENSHRTAASRPHDRVQNPSVAHPAENPDRQITTNHDAGNSPCSDTLKEKSPRPDLVQRPGENNAPKTEDTEAQKVMRIVAAVQDGRFQPDELKMLQDILGDGKSDITTTVGSVNDQLAKQGSAYRLFANARDLNPNVDLNYRPEDIAHLGQTRISGRIASSYDPKISFDTFQFYVGQRAFTRDRRFTTDGI